MLFIGRNVLESPGTLFYKPPGRPRFIFVYIVCRQKYFSLQEILKNSSVKFNLAISSVNFWGPYNGGWYDWLVLQPQPSLESKLKLNDAKINTLTAQFFS